MNIESKIYMKKDVVWLTIARSLFNNMDLPGIPEPIHVSREEKGLL